VFVKLVHPVYGGVVTSLEWWFIYIYIYIYIYIWYICMGETSPNGRIITAVFRLVNSFNLAINIYIYIWWSMCDLWRYMDVANKALTNWGCYHWLGSTRTCNRLNLRSAMKNQQWWADIGFLHCTRRAYEDELLEIGVLLYSGKRELYIPISSNVGNSMP